MYRDYDLTEDNIEKEAELLSFLMDVTNSDGYDVYDDLPSNFERYYCSWIEEYVWFALHSSKGMCDGGVSWTHQEGEIAVKFKNKFLSLHYKEGL